MTNTASYPNEVYHLSEQELEAVMDGIDQISEGLFLTHDEANKQVEDWFNIK